ncbi:MAG TPA: sulfite exporter TauE/SafE family protein [Kofleriaceae bacterium]
MLFVLPLAVLIGISLGMLGGGGSILSVPILTYVADMAPNAAIASSLFIVGVTSAAGAISHARAGRVRWRTGILFGTAGMVGAFVGGRLSAYIPGRALMIAFGIMMAATAVAMLRKRRTLQPPRVGDLPIRKVLIQGLAVGIVTGTIGAGGGFVVVPALVLLGGLGMEIAVGTSLIVIAMNSFAGLAGHLGNVDLDWPVTLAVTGAAVLGSLLGGRLVGRIPPAALRRGFAIFVIAMATLVLFKELS